MSSGEGPEILTVIFEGFQNQITSKARNLILSKHERNGSGNCLYQATCSGRKSGFQLVLMMVF